jgi:hypothetical protein
VSVSTGGEAAPTLSSVGHRLRGICEPVLTGERELFFRPLKRAPNSTRIDFPTLESVGYGSYDGYATDRMVARGGALQESSPALGAG